MFRPLFLCCSLIFAIFSVSSAQTSLGCTQTAVPPVLKGEGISERTGDLLLNCSGGAAGAQVTGNLSIFLTVNITNRIAAGNTLTGVDFTVDTGAGPQPINVAPIITGPGTMVFNGIKFNLSSTGSATLRIANIRANASQLDLAPNQQIQAFLGFNSNLVSVTTGEFSIGTPIRGLYAEFSTSIICSAKGSTLPANLHSVASFLASNAAFASTRVTEGFADAFAQRGAWESLHADTGTRIMVTYSGFPDGARLFVPDEIAGSDAIIPTAAGDLGVPASGGRYAPSTPGSLLLVRVQGTDANGGGGAPVYTPGSPGTGTVAFDSMNEVTLLNGAGIAVYEVMDANPNVQESAQFPTYLGLAPFSGDAVITSENVSFAPVSTVTQATTRDPIPRFQAIAPPSDCNIIGDCNASYYPRLFVNTDPMNFTAQSGGDFQVDYTEVQNHGGGHLVWSATVNYTTGSGWLRVDPDTGVDNATIRVDALPDKLAAGTYKAVLTVSGGLQAGSATIPITFIVTAPSAPPPTPTVTSVVNAATFAPGPAVPGSIATLLGSQLLGTNVVVGFDGLTAKILFANDTQINLVVPAALGNKQSTQMVVLVDGIQSIAQTVSLAEFGPGIFTNGILNQDGTVNGADHPASPGTVLQIFATGLSGTGAITARLNGAIVDPPAYGGVAPGLAGVQQVNVQLPTDLTGSSAQVSVCGGIPGKADQALCSPAVQVSIKQ